jgi:hypothetical protein
MKTLTSKEEFVNLGKRYSGKEIVKAVDRLSQLAAADLEKLVAGGYTSKMLAALNALRDEILKASAGCHDVRGTKQGARAGESVLLGDVRTALRRGIAIACAALGRREPAAGETPEATLEKIAELSSQVRALQSSSHADTAELRARLISLQTLLAAPDFAPDPDEKPARDAFQARLAALIQAITAQTESKKALRDRSKDKTAEVDELIGRAYANLRILSKVGRAMFSDEGDEAHARSYLLTELHRRRAKAGAQAPALDRQAGLAPVVPMPSPAQPAAGPAAPDSPIKPAVND